MVTITVNVEGMMCGHCEAHVNQAIKNAFQVEDVVSSHEKNTTVITAKEHLDEDKIRQVIKDAGYEVTGIQESMNELFELIEKKIKDFRLSPCYQRRRCV